MVLKDILKYQEGGLTPTKIQNIINRYGGGKSPFTVNDYMEVSKNTGVPIDLLLAQGIQESNLGTQGRAVRTKNVGNVGNTDNGTANYQNSWIKGLYRQADLLKKEYKVKDTTDVQRLVSNDFIRPERGGRYATDKNYGSKVGNLLNKLHGKKVYETNKNTQTKTEKDKKQSNLPPINGGSWLTYNEGTPLPSTTSDMNFWSLPIDIQSTIIENQKLESERLNQEIVANEWEKENLAIEAGLKQKQLERQQILNTIPQAQYVGQTKLQPNPLTLPQSNVEFMQQGGRVTYNKEGDYYGTEDIEEVIISPQQPFRKNTTDNLRINRELDASLNLKNYKGKNQVSQDVIKENTPWYLKTLAPTTTEKANNIFNDLSNYYNKRNRLPMRVDENSSSLDKEIASNVNSQIGVYSKEENDLRNRISNASTFFYPEGIQDLDNLVSNIENNKQGEAKVKAYFNNEKHTDLTNALTDKYFNVGDTSAFIVPSNYRPTKTTDQNTSYYDFSDTEKRKLIQDLIDNGIDLNFNSYVDKRAKSKNKVLQTGNFYGLNQLGNYTLSGGEDENGKYLSYYDKWDLAASRNKNIDNTINKINNPFEIYGRIYEKDFNLLKNKK